jgi:soluble lytic murein transglycosylase-like protein
MQTPLVIVIGRRVAHALTVFWRDVWQGMLGLGRHSLVAVGLLVVAVGVFVSGKPELRDRIEAQALEWLQMRHVARSEAEGDLLRHMAEPTAVSRATAIDPARLDESQATLARWIARRYRVATEPVGRLVQEAWDIGQRAGMPPTLILAVMAVESSFNPFAQSHAGAQGLMQVLTRVHDEKFEAFGGRHAAFDPLTNLRVGVQILRDGIARAGSVEGGLKIYVGAANLPHDGGYAAKVLAEQEFMQRVAGGERVPFNVPLLAAVAERSATSQP